MLDFVVVGCDFGIVFVTVIVIVRVHVLCIAVDLFNVMLIGHGTVFIFVTCCCYRPCLLH